MRRLNPLILALLFFLPSTPQAKDLPKIAVWDLTPSKQKRDDDPRIAALYLAGEAKQSNSYNRKGSDYRVPVSSAGSSPDW